MPKRTEKLDIRLSYETKKAFGDACAKNGQSASAVLREAIGKAIQRRSQIAKGDNGTIRLPTTMPRMAAVVLVIALLVAGAWIVFKDQLQTTENIRQRFAAIQEIPSEKMRARLAAWRNVMANRLFEGDGENIDFGGNIAISLELCADGSYRYFYISKNELSLAAAENRTPEPAFIAGEWDILPSRGNITLEAIAYTGERGEFYLNVIKDDVIDIGGNPFRALPGVPEKCEGARSPLAD